MVKSLPATAGDIRDVVLILGGEDPLKEGMTTHSNILAGEFHGQRKSGGLRSEEHT